MLANFGIGALAWSAGLLARDVEVELDKHVVRVVEEDLPTRAVRHLVDAERHAFLRKMLLDGRYTSAGVQISVSILHFFRVI